MDKKRKLQVIAIGGLVSLASLAVVPWRFVIAPLGAYYLLACLVFVTNTPKEGMMPKRLAIAAVCLAFAAWLWAIVVVSAIENSEASRAMYALLASAIIITGSAFAICVILENIRREEN